MRLARLAAAGLGLGMFAGFCVALLRARPAARPAEPTAAPVTEVPRAAGERPAGAAEQPANAADDPPSDATGQQRTVDVTALEADSDVPGRVI